MKHILAATLLALFVTGALGAKPSKLVGQWSNPEGVASYCEDDRDTNPSDDASLGSVIRVIDHIVEAMEVRDIVVTFTDDGHVSASVQGNTIEGEYTLEGNTLTITSNGKTFPVTIQMKDTQLTFLYPLSRCPQQVRQYFRDIPTEGLCLGVRLYRK